MLTYSAQIDISAPPEKIWNILTDGVNYIEWDPGIMRLEGTIAPGEKITVYTKLSPDRAFPVTVSTFEPPHKMIWSSAMPLGLFKGERTFTLEALPNGGTKFATQEVFSGLLLPIIGRTIPDLTSTFAAFAKALKQRAETMG